MVELRLQVSPRFLGYFSTYKSELELVVMSSSMTTGSSLALNVISVQNNLEQELHHFRHEQGPKLIYLGPPYLQP